MLVNCPECDRQISHTARRCPNCGHNLKPFKVPLWGKAALGIVAIALIYLVADARGVIPHPGGGMHFSLIPPASLCPIPLIRPPECDKVGL